VFEGGHEIAERARIVFSVAGGDDVLRILAAAEQTDVGRGARQRRTVPFECESLVRHVPIIAKAHRWND
jgi:hypothetical protein